LLDFEADTEPNGERTLRAFKQNGQQTIILILVVVEGVNGKQTKQEVEQR
tara:strand:- start:3901 stop:4050 length:150 start_codon:yes stop_codon:yes gene_type:complete